MKCWYCGKAEMQLEPDKRFLQCPECKATANTSDKEWKKPEEK